MKKLYIYFAIFMLIFPACNEILEEDPKSFVSPDGFFNTESEAEAALFGVYDFLNSRSPASRFIGEVDWISIGWLGTDVGKTRDLSRTKYQKGELEQVQADYITWWRLYYRAIGAANMVISRVEASEKFPADFKKRIVGEAKFLRAFFYHHLHLIWGNVPVWTEELDLNEVEVLPNSPAYDVNTQIIQDLIDAANNLPSSVSEAGRVSLWVAKGLLARVYLLSNQWQLAKDMAKDVIDNSPHSLLPSYYDVFEWTNKNNSELIHVVPHETDIEGSMIHSFSSPRPFDEWDFEIPEGVFAIRPDGVLTRDKESRLPGSLFQGWGMLQTFKENYDSYADGDTRKEIWWHEIKFTDGTSMELGGGAGIGLPDRSGYYPLKWIAWDETPNNGGRDIHHQRLAELYLIYAEAENELNGPTADAYDAINTIRQRAFGDSDHDLSGLGKDQFRLAIIDENRWELGGEGLRRWYLWHWGYDTYMKANEFVKESNPDNFANLKPHHRYFKIPPEEIVKNPNLVQNPGY